MVAGFAGAAGVACFGCSSVGWVRSEQRSQKAFAAVVGCFVCRVLVVLVGSLRGFAAGASAVVEASVAAEGSAGKEASVGTSVAASAPVALMAHDVHSHHSAPGNQTASVSSVGPSLLCPYASMCFHTWRDSRLPRGSGRPGYQVLCPPTSHIPLAISRTRLDGLCRSSLRIPKSAHIADPIFCVSWIRARRLWTPFLGYRVEL